MKRHREISQDAHSGQVAASNDNNIQPNMTDHTSARTQNNSVNTHPFGDPMMVLSPQYASQQSIQPTFNYPSTSAGFGRGLNLPETFVLHDTQPLEGNRNRRQEGGFCDTITLEEAKDAWTHNRLAVSSSAQFPALEPPFRNTFSTTNSSDPKLSPAAFGNIPSIGQPTNMTGLYSASGFDVTGLLARLVTRPNPQINVGPIDFSCSFVVSDARKFDFPIIYVSPTFETLTGYQAQEIIGTNCRFLQSPDANVAVGSRRKYTDNAAVFHMKTHIMSGKESQVSAINYRKGGQPFVNLITIIPLTWDSDEIAYFVGLQVDLVEQPNSILAKMKDGTYVLNYQMKNHINYAPSLPGTLVEQVEDYFKDLPTSTAFPASSEVLNMIKQPNDNVTTTQRRWLELVLDQTHDFIHVISLKGIFLYCSPASKAFLDYEPEDLIGRSISSVCHPSDIVAVMRELKQSQPGETVDIVYRARRQHGGYIWVECQGNLHLEAGKGRKSLILSARERPVYRLTWTDVWNARASTQVIAVKEEDRMNRPGLVREDDLWSKMSLDGLFMYCGKVPDMLGYTVDELVGMSIYQLTRSESMTDVTKALSHARDGNALNLWHYMQSKKGSYFRMQSTFYPGDMDGSKQKPAFLIVQTRQCNVGQRELSSASTESSHSPATVASSPDPMLILNTPSPNLELTHLHSANCSEENPSTLEDNAKRAKLEDITHSIAYTPGASSSDLLTSENAKSLLRDDKHL